MRSAGAAALLADGRFPAGGHAHSSGYEPASAAFGIDTARQVEQFVAGRLTTTGRTEIALLAAIHHRLELDADAVDWRVVDTEIDVRIASPALRETSRTLGRQWLRAGRRIWPSTSLEALAAAVENNPHQVAVSAAMFHAAQVPAPDAAAIHLHHLIASVTTAAVRLHGLDPYEMQRVEVTLLPLAERLVGEALTTRDLPYAQLPAATGPLNDFFAEDHARWDHRLFQS